MKTLYLVRHAEAIPDDIGVNDFKRLLSKAGRDDAQAMGKRLCEKAISPDLLVSSPADRDIETAHIFAQKLGYPRHKILLKEGIYDAADERLGEVIRGLDDFHNTVMLFGHEPALSQFANFLMQNSETELPAAGVVGISLDIPCWRDIAKGTGMLILFDFPVHVTPKIYKKARKAIAKEISSTMEHILGNISDDKTSRHVQKIIQKSGKKLAKEIIKALEVTKVEEISGVTTQKRVDNLRDHQVEMHFRPDTKES